MAKQPIQLRPLEDEQLGISLASSAHESMQHFDQQLMVPHRHDHYCCFLLASGQINFIVDGQPMDIVGPALMVSYPGQVHQLGHAREVSGWFVAFKARLVDEHARHVFEGALARVALLPLAESEVVWFADLLTLLESALSQSGQDRFRQGVLAGLLNAFLCRAATLFQSQEAARIEAYSFRSVELAKTFQQLVNVHFQTQKRPSEYANRMNLTTSYLNDTVKAVTGFSATHFIQQAVFAEAQRLLVYSAGSVKEIAFQLGYEDHKYFIRLFGKAVGCTPTQFRERYRA